MSPRCGKNRRIIEWRTRVASARSGLSHEAHQRIEKLRDMIGNCTFPVPMMERLRCRCLKPAAQNLVALLSEHRHDPIKLAAMRIPGDTAIRIRE